MSWFAENMAESLVVLGLALLVIEILILGFATFILLFVIMWIAFSISV